MKRIPKIVLVGLVLILAGFLACGRHAVTLTKVTHPPVATRQLEPAVFVNQTIIKKMGIREGDPVFVSANDRKVEVRIYKYFKDDSSCGLHRKELAQLKLSYGPALIKIEPAGKKATLKSDPIKRKIEYCTGDTARWPDMVLGTPHADCDNETGVIAKRVNREAKIPCVAAWKHRLSYRGIWYDVNRPLMKLPLPNGHGVQRVRVVNDSSRAVFERYKRQVYRALERPENTPISFYFDLHGHDLTVRLPSGKRVYRSVVEAVGTGFTLGELRRIKSVYNRFCRNNCDRNFPPLYFGNLPEDQTYKYKGVKVHIFYTALGTRTYGILRNDLAIRGLHMETPDTLRLTPEMQKKTARLLEKLFTFVRDSLPNTHFSKKIFRFQKLKFRENRLVPISGGSFTMGAPEGMGWACSHPQHIVKVSDFSLNATEVTNAAYAVFLNKSLKEGSISIENGVVREAKNPSHIFCRLASNRPFSQIKFDGKIFSAVSGREHFPVVYVSWYGAEAYARHFKKRLPTEAEWEYAAGHRGNKQFIFGYGSNAFRSSGENCENSGDPFEKGLYPWTTPVGFYPANSNGLFDMSGNVWEWCADYFEYYYYKHEPAAGWVNPSGPDSGTMRSIRGGAWNTEFPFTATYFRLGIDPNATLINLGFRCAK